MDGIKPVYGREILQYQQPIKELCAIDAELAGIISNSLIRKAADQRPIIIMEVVSEWRNMLKGPKEITKLALKK